MNILFIWKAPFKNGGGVGEVTIALGSQFLRKGHQVSFLSLSTGIDYEIEGIRQYFISQDKLIQRLKFKKLKDFIRFKNIDVVINQSGIFNISMIKSINEMNNRPIIISVHHNCISCFQEQYEQLIRKSSNPVMGILSKIKLLIDGLKYRNKISYGIKIEKTIKYSDKFLLLSKAFLSELSVYTTNFDPKKVDFIHNAINNSFFSREVMSIDKKKKKLIYVGRLNYSQKQVHLLLDIWEALYRKHRDWEFDIIGDGEKKEELILGIKSKKLERIYIHGHQSPNSYLDESLILLLPSLFEGFGLVLVEAQARGVIPVAFDCFSSIREIINDNEGGFVIPLNNLDSIISKVDELMKSKNESLKVLSTNAIINAERFKSDIIANKWLSLIASLKMTN